MRSHHTWRRLGQNWRNGCFTSRDHNQENNNPKTLLLPVRGILGLGKNMPLCKFRGFCSRMARSHRLEAFFSLHIREKQINNKPQQIPLRPATTAHRDTSLPSRGVEQRQTSTHITSGLLMAEWWEVGIWPKLAKQTCSPGKLKFRAEMQRDGELFTAQ